MEPPYWKQRYRLGFARMRHAEARENAENAW